jgi:hypothetical protein
MAAISVLAPYPVFNDRDGQPLDDGNIYVGTENLDPITNPIQVYWDEALTVPATQPIKTSGGFPSYQGTPADLYVNADNFSITVTDKNDLLVYTSLRGAIKVSIPPSSITADQVEYDPPFTGALTSGYTVEDKLSQAISVKDFGAVGDGTADDTAAIQDAIDSFASGQGTIYFPKGRYLITSTVTIDQDRINLVGEGVWVTEILFEPSADDICFFFGKGGEGTTNAGAISQCSLREMSFRSTNLTYKKTALELKDISLFRCDNVAIGGSTRWLGNGSIGVRIRGREASSFSNMYVQTNRPFSFAQNTNFPTICLDHFNFHNMYTACRGHLESPAVLGESNFFFEPGVNFSNISFTGYQAWLRGRYGLYYDNSVTAAAGQSYNMNIQNVRWEGDFGFDDTGYGFYFSHGATSTVDNITIQNVRMGEIGNGYYFRKFVGVTLMNNVWSRTTGEVLNIDSTVGTEFVQIINCFWQTGSTASIGTAFAPISGVIAPTTGPVYKSVIYTASQSAYRRDLIAGVPINQGAIAVAAPDPTVVTLPLDATATVICSFTDSRGKFALIGFNESAKTTTLIYNDGTWSNTQGTAASLNVYWNAGTSAWELENKVGVSRQVFMQALGSNQ